MNIERGANKIKSFLAESFKVNGNATLTAMPGVYAGSRREFGIESNAASQGLSPVEEPTISDKEPNSNLPQG